MAGKREGLDGDTSSWKERHFTNRDMGTLWASRAPRENRYWTTPRQLGRVWLRHPCPITLRGPSEVLNSSRIKKSTGLWSWVGIPAPSLAPFWLCDLKPVTSLPNDWPLSVYQWEVVFPTRHICEEKMVQGFSMLIAISPCLLSPH